MMDLGRLRALAALDQHGSVHAAAAALHLTPSAISQQLAKLERETGSVLLEKDGRGLRLTDAGKLLAEQAFAVLDRVEQAEAALAAHHNTVSGRITIAAFATACRGLLPTALAHLRAEHPQLMTSLAEINPYEALAAVIRAQADVALVDDWPEVGLHLPEGISYAELGLDHADLIVPTDHPLANADQVHLADLPKEQWIASPPGTICHDWLLRVLPGISPDYLLGEFESQLTLIAAGLGVAMIPRLARARLPQGTVAVRIEPLPTRRVMVLWRASSAARPAVGAAVDALRRAWDERADLGEQIGLLSRAAPPAPAAP